MAVGFVVGRAGWLGHLRNCDAPAAGRPTLVLQPMVVRDDCSPWGCGFLIDSEEYRFAICEKVVAVWIFAKRYGAPAADDFSVQFDDLLAHVV